MHTGARGALVPVEGKPVEARAAWTTQSGGKAIYIPLNHLIRGKLLPWIRKQK